MFCENVQTTWRDPLLHVTLASYCTGLVASRLVEHFQPLTWPWCLATDLPVAQLVLVTFSDVR